MRRAELSMPRQSALHRPVQRLGSEHSRYLGGMLDGRNPRFHGSRRTGWRRISTDAFPHYTRSPAFLEQTVCDGQQSRGRSRQAPILGRDKIKFLD